MTWLPKLFVAACSVLLLACSKPEATRPDPSSTVRSVEATFSTVLGPAQMGTGADTPAERLDCGHDHFKFADALRQLPGGMARVLSGGQAMADHGENFNVGDAVQYEGAPFRRFAAAAVGDDKIFAAVEQGGIGYSVEYWAFERQGSQWIGNRRWFGDVPSSLPAILSVACVAKGEVTGRRDCPRPDYPLAAMRAKAQGVTTVELTVDETGHVSDGKVVQGSGKSREHGLLDRAAVESLRACTFAAAADPGPRHTTLSYVWALE